MNKRVIWTILLFFALAVVMASCAAFKTKPTEANFKNPIIKLESFEVPQYDGYWYFSKKVKPTKGEAGNRGAPLPMSFLFAITNPNPYPVLLEEIKFTVAFDKDFELVTFNIADDYWIPAGKTDYVRCTTMITTRSALLSLLVTGGFKLKAKGWNVWQALERWWKGVPEFKVPITVKEGAFTFTADGVTRVLPFEANFP
ncbi:MAG TPA: hypothetical protein EYP06_00880 [Desulfobacterales bacterium]|nr:hypothetical protein [Desulfobacterales bacterium]